MAAEYNGTTDKADTGYSSGVEDLNIFYDVNLRSPPMPASKCSFLTCANRLAT